MRPFFILLIPLLFLPATDSIITRHWVLLSINSSSVGNDLSNPFSSVSRPALAALAFGAIVIGAHAAETSKAGPAIPQTAVQWKQAAIADIEEGVRLTIDNHPGVYDPANPGFVKKLEEAKQQGLALATRVNNAASYMAAVDRFNNAIGDGHAGMYPSFDPGAQVTERWPGFVTVWRQDGLYVYASEDAGPPAGSKVLSCDGKPIEAIIRSNVFAFVGHVNEPGHWWSQARRVFGDEGNPFINLPTRCEFALSGKRYAQDLVWKARSEQANKWRQESYNGQTLPVGLSEPRKNLFWAAMPTFDPDEKQRDAYRGMFREIESQRQRFLNADAVVIDLRENQGGSSMWPTLFASALWGADRVERRAAAWAAKEEVWWRASKGNTDYVASLVERLTEEKQLESVEWLKPKRAGMQAALARGDKFFVVKEEAKPVVSNADADRPGDPPAFTRPVYVIVPGQCASACLDALDTFTRFSNTKLIGAPSAADSTYMEVRHQTTRSGLATVIIPVKVYVNRPRGNGQGYLPSIYVNDLNWSVATFEKVVEQDLAQRQQ